MITTKNPNYKTVSFEDSNGVMARFNLYKRSHAKKEIKRKKDYCLVFTCQEIAKILS